MRSPEDILYLEMFNLATLKAQKDALFWLEFDGRTIFTHPLEGRHVSYMIHVDPHLTPEEINDLPPEGVHVYPSGMITVAVYWDEFEGVDDKAILEALVDKKMKQAVRELKEAVDAQ